MSNLKKIEYFKVDGHTVAHIDDNILDNENFIYVSNGDWYDKDSICRVDANCGTMGGLFIGCHTVTSEIEAKNRDVSIGYKVILDGEMCRWEEFDIYDKGRTLLVKAEIDMPDTIEE